MRVHDARHDQAAAVALDRLQDAVGRVLRIEDGQEPLEAGLHAREHPRGDVERADDRRPDAAPEPLQLEAERLVEADRRVLARAVVDQTRRADDAGGGGNGHDVAAVPPHHLGEEGARRPEERERVHLEGAEHVVVRRLEERLPGHHAGVVDEHVHVAVVAERRRRRRTRSRRGRGGCRR